jgi:hypothetical protein
MTPRLSHSARLRDAVVEWIRNVFASEGLVVGLHAIEDYAAPHSELDRELLRLILLEEVLRALKRRVNEGKAYQTSAESLWPLAEVLADAALGLPADSRRNPRSLEAL